MSSAPGVAWQHVCNRRDEQVVELTPRGRPRRRRLELERGRSHELGQPRAQDADAARVRRALWRHHPDAQFIVGQPVEDEHRAQAAGNARDVGGRRGCRVRRGRTGQTQVAAREQVQQRARSRELGRFERRIRLLPAQLEGDGLAVHILLIPVEFLPQEVGGDEFRADVFEGGECRVDLGERGVVVARRSARRAQPRPRRHAFARAGATRLDGLQGGGERLLGAAQLQICIGEPRVPHAGKGIEPAREDLFEDARRRARTVPRRSRVPRCSREGSPESAATKTSRQVPARAGSSRGQRRCGPASTAPRRPRSGSASARIRLVPARAAPALSSGMRALRRAGHARDRGGRGC